VSAPSETVWLPVERQTLSVVLPAYNEEDNIEAAVEAVREAASSLVPAWECIVVDDGSTDATPMIVDRMAAVDPRIRPVTFPRNRGFGLALKEGFGHCRGDLIFYTDSDRQFDVRELRYFLPLMERYDAAFGFRVYRYDGALRVLLSWCYNRLVRLLFRVKVRDVDCSFKLFRREVLESIDLESEDFFVDTELVAKARKWNYRIIEKGVRHYPRPAGQSTVRPSDIPRTLRTVARMWWRIYVPSSRRARASVCPPNPERLVAGKISEVAASRD
jgi:glycosyltransferase involved in cell wall biosynthesis